MLEGQSLVSIFRSGGLIMYVLVVCSIISIAVIIDRLNYFRQRSAISRAEFMEKLSELLATKNISIAIEYTESINTPFAKVALVGLRKARHGEKIIAQAMERETSIETIKLERFTSIAGTIGSTSVYIGLLGTVFGIMHSFRDIATKGAGELNVVIGGISEALICTAAGLIVAIPAVISYNFFVRRIDQFIADMELTSSEVLDLLAIHKHV